MEEYYTVAEAINYLLDRGYSFQFDLLCDLPISFTKPHARNIPDEDFQIDEIFRCRDLSSRASTCYVFAVSS